ncbi:hypothetical protein [Viridibacillus arvi]|uniref:hypothetical protein n=1 Tax=Viridibacillus arvi TaxID=263475 RepID=UPI0034CF5BE7
MDEITLKLKNKEDLARIVATLIRSQANTFVVDEDMRDLTVRLQIQAVETLGLDTYNEAVESVLRKK